MGMAGKNTATATLEPRSRPLTPTESFLTGYRSLPESSTIVWAILEKRNQLIILRSLQSLESCILGSKLANRRGKKGRSIRGEIEIAHDSMENSMLGNPIDENTL